MIGEFALIINGYTIMLLISKVTFKKATLVKEAEKEHLFRF